MKPIQDQVPIPKDRTVFIQQDVLDKFLSLFAPS